MQCAACTRSDASKTFYCQSCLSTRLAEHYSSRQKYRNALTLVTSKAAALLAGTEKPAGAGGGGAGRPLGVREERLLKAEKWTLASKVYATRKEAEFVKEANEEAVSPSLPLSLPSLNARIADLSQSMSLAAAEISQARGFYSLELREVFAFEPAEPVLLDPFSPDPAASTYPPRSSGPPTPFPRSYTLAGLPLPPVSQLLTLAGPDLEALLSHLLHLTRLLALYQGVLLPFAPLPSCFGPGRPGVKAVKGVGEALDKLAPVSGTAATDEGSGNTTPKHRSASSSVATITPAEPAATQAATSGVGVDCWPLCFRAKKSSPSASGDAGDNGAGEPADAPSDAEDRQTVTSSRSARSSASHAAGAGRGVWASKKTAKRAKAVLVGAVALVYDLAYIAWARETREAAEGIAAWSEEDLDDLGTLLHRALGLRDDAGAVQIIAASPFVDPDPSPSLSTGTATNSNRASFPLSFSSVVAFYTSLAFPASTPRADRAKTGRNGSKASASGESSVVVEAEEGEEEDEEEWDFV
ncbi:hypothetical protein JCM10213v2_002558 [Rhodosporidiobolus nylandii]